MLNSRLWASSRILVVSPRPPLLKPLRWQSMALKTLFAKPKFKFVVIELASCLAMPMTSPILWGPPAFGLSFGITLLKTRSLNICRKLCLTRDRPNMLFGRALNLWATTQLRACLCSGPFLVLIALFRLPMKCILTSLTMFLVILRAIILLLDI